MHDSLFFKGLIALQGHSADICSSQLNILYFNARSLLPKLDELRLICTFKNPDIVCVVESWLCCDISDSELSINGYCITRLDRNRHGGGILFFIKSIFHVNVLSYHPFNLELLILRITGSFSFKLSIGLFYRPPNSLCTIFDHLLLVLQSLDVRLFSNFVLIGDFNVNFSAPFHQFYSYLCNSVLVSQHILIYVTVC